MFDDQLLQRLSAGVKMRAQTAVSRVHLPTAPGRSTQLQFGCLVLKNNDSEPRDDGGTWMGAELEQPLSNFVHKPARAGSNAWYLVWCQV